MANSASSKILEKATKDDIASFQSYTIRNLDKKLCTKSDIEQYKIVSANKETIDNRQSHLDVIYFPVLFPMGEFGMHHPREVPITPSKYIKSHLYNWDS